MMPGVMMFAMGIVIMATSLFTSALPQGATLVCLFTTLAGAGIILVARSVEGERYFLTSFRIIRTNKGKILDQLSRRLFIGKTLSEYVDTVKLPSTRHTSSLWAVRILNPDNRVPAMDLGVVSGGDVKRLKTVADIIYCQYCGAKNEFKASKCSNCGAKI